MVGAAVEGQLQCQVEQSERLTMEAGERILKAHQDAMQTVVALKGDLSRRALERSPCKCPDCLYAVMCSMVANFYIEILAKAGIHGAQILSKQLEEAERFCKREVMRKFYCQVEEFGLKPTEVDDGEK